MQKAKRVGASPLNDKIYREITDGLTAYFESALGSLLLYRFERQQYKDILTKYPEKNLSEIYGCEHLLRLFVKLPQLLSQAQMDAETLQVLQLKLSEILKFLHKNCEKFLSELNYEAASDPYLENWKEISE